MGRRRTGYHQGERVVRTLICREVMTQMRDITFFGQALDSEFDECLFKDREEVDLLVIIGTSLKVAPVSEVLSE
jgi:NAD-dependent SIR2 family protein deacetylase